MKIFKKIITWVLALAVIGYGAYVVATAPKISESDIASMNGLHWHAHLTININGENVVIPTDIGVTGAMGAGGDPMALHTHAEDSIVHAEYAGLVTKEQLTLKHFFEAWGKDFSKDSILGHKAGNGHTIIMTVNGKPNDQFENYSITGKGMFDGGELGLIDDIEIIYK